MNVAGSLVYHLIALPLSLLPRWLWYAVSGVLSVLFFNFIRYRYDVIYTNLRGVYPLKSEEELDDLIKKFYRNFTDIFIAENFIALNPLRRPFDQMIYLKNPEVLLPYYQMGKNVILLAGHQGNWELLAHLSSQASFRHQIMGIYKKQSPIAEYLLLKSRTRSGGVMIDNREVQRVMAQITTKPAAWLFIADQSPSSPKSAFWTRFLGRETGFLTGAEVYARRLDMPVFFTDIRRISRGKYEFSFQLISDQPKQTQRNEITQRYAQLLEQRILGQPDAWLWSHRRWKHQKPESHD
ncbi:MAG TPA: lysophospholipid acyltransferase family protein [Luteibaculaceae bacterium]|nr:lysophospholipid acyltransferase family protein [Luteibaculaceae bacterium]